VADTLNWRGQKMRGNSRLNPTSSARDSQSHHDPSRSPFAQHFEHGGGIRNGQSIAMDGYI